MQQKGNARYKTLVSGKSYITDTVSSYKLCIVIGICTGFLLTFTGVGAATSLSNMYKIDSVNQSISSTVSPVHEMTVDHRFQCLMGHPSIHQAEDLDSEACTTVEIEEVIKTETGRDRIQFNCKFYVGRPASYETTPIPAGGPLTTIYGHQSPCTFLCQDLRPRSASSVRRISILGDTQVHCDMEDGAGGSGWTTIQRRMDGSVDFYRNWTEYKTGFGEPSGEYWLGLDAIHQITKSYDKVLIRIKATAGDGDEMYMIFEGFSVESEDKNYKLNAGYNFFLFK